MRYSNIAAEFRLLAGLCHHTDMFFKLVEHLSSKDFTQKAHIDFFVVLQSIMLSSEFDQPVIDRHSLLAKASELGITNFYEECDNGEVIDACLQYSCDADDVVDSFKQVKKEAIRRNIIGQLENNLKYLQEASDDPIETIVGKVEKDFLDTLGKLEGATENKLISLNEVAFDVIDDLAQHPGEIGLDIGFPLWQRSMGHIRNGAVTFIAANTKCGKSQFGVYAAMQAAQKIPVIYCDTELNTLTQSVRTIGNFLGVNFEILETGWWKKPKEEILKAGYDEAFANQCILAKKNLEEESVRRRFRDLKFTYLNVNGLTVQDALPLLRRWVLQNVGMNDDAKAPRCLIVWDYIKLTHVGEVRQKGVGAHDLLGAATSALHDFAEKYNLPILAFGQTNREIDDNINCIAGAKKITELTDSCSLLKVKGDDDVLIDPDGTHMMKVFVSRFGRGLKGHINVKADLGMARFEELGLGKVYVKTKDDGETNKSKDRKDKRKSKSQYSQDRIKT